MSNELGLNAEVVCADGPAGRLTDIVLDPHTDQVTHLVVEAAGFGHPRRLTLSKARIVALLVDQSAGWRTASAT